MHSGEWDKMVKGVREIRGKVFGIVGYGYMVEVVVRGFDLGDDIQCA